jgi:chitin disaccharide deacetylase
VNPPTAGAARVLIVNADDFGLSAGVNRGIVEAHERGIVTSASLMVRGPAAREAANYVRTHPALGVGLHTDLCEWVYRDGEWMLAYEVVPTNDDAAMSAEIERQLAIFRDLVGQNPTHIDSHQHIHWKEPARSAFLKIANALSIPLRNCSPAVRYCGDFYGQSAKSWPYPEGIGAEQLLRVITTLPCGVTELGCHPGFADDLDSVYREERAKEVAALCDPRVRSAIEAEKIALASFRAVTG